MHEFNDDHPLRHSEGVLIFTWQKARASSAGSGSSASQYCWRHVGVQDLDLLDRLQQSTEPVPPFDDKESDGSGEAAFQLFALISH